MDNTFFEENIVGILIEDPKIFRKEVKKNGMIDQEFVAQLAKYIVTQLQKDEPIFIKGEDDYYVDYEYYRPSTLLHLKNPKAFNSMLEKMINYARKRLPRIERDFIVDLIVKVQRDFISPYNFLIGIDNYLSANYDYESFYTDEEFERLENSILEKESEIIRTNNKEDFLNWTDKGEFIPAWYINDRIDGFFYKFFKDVYDYDYDNSNFDFWDFLERRRIWYS